MRLVLSYFQTALVLLGDVAGLLPFGPNVLLSNFFLCNSFQKLFAAGPLAKPVPVGVQSIHAIAVLIGKSLDRRKIRNKHQRLYVL